MTLRIVFADRAESRRLVGGRVPDYQAGNPDYQAVWYRYRGLLGDWGPGSRSEAVWEWPGSHVRLNTQTYTLGTHHVDGLVDRARYVSRPWRC